MNGYRPSPFANLTPVVKNLLIINIICFLPFLLFDHGKEVGPYSQLFGVYYFNSPFFHPWQVVTYMFLHGGWDHIFFNMFALFSFGPILEYSIGSQKFFNLYFICGIGAVIFQMFVQAFELQSLTGSFILSNNMHINSPEVYSKVQAIFGTPSVGASGAIFGVLVAFAMLYPDMELMILFIPVPVKAKYIIPVYIAIEIFLQLAQFGGDNVGHLAHLGGALFGFILIKAWRLR